MSIPYLPKNLGLPVVLYSDNGEAPDSTFIVKLSHREPEIYEPPSLSVPIELDEDQYYKPDGGFRMLLSAEVPSVYKPPKLDVPIILLSDNGIPPDSSFIITLSSEDEDFVPPPRGDDQYFFPVGEDSSSISVDSSVHLYTRYVAPLGLLGSTALGRPKLFNKTTVITHNKAWQSSVVAKPFSVINVNRYYQPLAIDSLRLGDIEIRNRTPSVFPIGITPKDTGVPAVGYAIRLIKPGGFDRLLLGKPVVIKTPELLPKSIDSQVFSKPTVWFKNRKLQAVGFNAYGSGVAIAWFRYRHTYAASWLSSRSGTPLLTHGVREVIASGFMRDAYGYSWVSHGTRILQPATIAHNYTSKHIVGRPIELKPVGFIATKFGTRIIPVSQDIYSLGFTGIFGQASAYLSNQHIEPKGYISVGQQPQDRWGKTTAYNLRQYINQKYDGSNGLVPPKWSDWTLVENRNKKITTAGRDFQKFGYAAIYNNATALNTLGIAPPALTKKDKGMVSHANRPIALDGLSPPLIGAWAVVYNDARVVSQKGLVHTLSGTASLSNTRRYYQSVGRIDSMAFGISSITHRIRTLDIETRYSIGPPPVRLPVIDNLMKYATFNGYETAKYGTPSLIERFNIITPRWSHKEKSGEPFVYNLTPEIGAYGHNSELFGVSVVRTQWRNIYARGDIATYFGRNKIADSKQLIDIRGWQDASVSQKHVVVKTGAPPYSEQRISLDGDLDIETNKYTEGNGIFFDELVLGKRVPKPGLNQNVLYPKGQLASLYGNAILWSNNIQILAGIAIHNVPTGATVANTKRFITLRADDAIDAEIKVGRPRMSPHTIYSVNNAPKQAITNHPTTWAIRYVGATVNRDSGFICGYPTVESSIRRVYQRALSSTSFGEAALTLKLRVISPKSFVRRAFGIPSIPFTPQYMQVFNNNGASSSHGNPTVFIPDTGDKTLIVKSIPLLAIGSHKVVLKTRYLLAYGRESLAMGARKAGDNPYMWQGLRVGAHVPTSISGGDTSLYGEGMVSLRVRGLEAEGFNAFRSEYDTAAFRDRMKVAYARKTIDDIQRITTHGFNALENSYNTEVALGQHYIKPDGNSDQFRKGGYHA